MRIFQIGFLCIVALVLAAQDKQADKIEKLAPYYPTPQIIVEKMLQLGGLKAGEKMFDLGSGDGRIVIMAAQKFKADATGVEFDDSLFNQSMARTVLAVACLAWYVFIVGGRSAWVLAALAAYPIFAAGTLAQVRFDSARLALIALMVDTTYFALWTWAVPAGPMSALVFGFLLA